jgi:hypothetical protein
VLLHVYHQAILKRKSLENTEKQWIPFTYLAKKYYITKMVKNADLGRNLCDSKANIVGKICDDVCMKHDIPSRHIVLPIFLFCVWRREKVRSMLFYQWTTSDGTV